MAVHSSVNDGDLCALVLLAVSTINYFVDSSSDDFWCNLVFKRLLHLANMWAWEQANVGGFDRQRNLFYWGSTRVLKHVSSFLSHRNDTQKKRVHLHRLKQRAAYALANTDCMSTHNANKQRIRHTPPQLTLGSYRRGRLGSCEHFKGRD